MTRIGALREAFDRDMDFEAVKEFKFDGKKYIPGQAFPKELASTRGLRQLYDHRFLRMVLPDYQENIVREERPRPVFELGNNVPKDEVEAVKPKRVKLKKTA